MSLVGGFERVNCRLAIFFKKIIMLVYTESKAEIKPDLNIAIDDITGEKYKVKGLLIVREKSRERVIYRPNERFFKAVIFPGECYRFELTDVSGEILLK